MSDNGEDYEYDYGSDAEYDYGSDVENEDQDIDDETIQIENMYYEGDDLKNNDKQRAIELFESVVERETAQGNEIKWRFKSLLELVIIYYKINDFNSMKDRYQKMLTFISDVTRNECTDAINSILDAISNVSDAKTLSEMYEITLHALKSANNERLWFNTNIKLARVYLQLNRYQDVDSIIHLLKSSCSSSDGKDDTSKGNLLLEVYCLEIQLCSITRNNARMKAIYPKTLNLNTVVADPRIMGIIREEGGKMHMVEGNWDEAYNELYEAFRGYQEAGNSHAKSCLKYVVLASMLALSDINPFAAREAKVYADDPEILAMSDLRQSLESNNLEKFESILKNSRNGIMNEPFLNTYIQPLRKRMKEQILVNLALPYRTLTLKSISTELSLSLEEAEELVVDLISDKRIRASIDQLRGIVILENDKNCLKSESNDILVALNKWADVLRTSNDFHVNRSIN